MNDEVKQDIEQKTAATPRGVRGPSYPSISLGEAIDRAQAFYTFERRNAAPTSSAAKHWGYSETSSSWRLVLAALLQFGLLEDSGSSSSRFVKLSELALDILLDSPESPKRLTALQTAARSPKIYNEILNKWKPDELPSDQTLKYYLLREKGFNAGSVDNFIKDFRSSISFAKLDKPTTIQPLNASNTLFDQGQNEGEASDIRNDEIPMTSQPSTIQASYPLRQVGVPITPSVLPPLGVKQDTFSLDEGQIVLQWPAQMSELSYEDFKDWIELQLRKIKRSVHKKHDQT